LFEVGVEGAVEDAEAGLFEGEEFGGKAVDEFAVVGGDDGGPFEVFEAPGESGNGFEVEVVVGLVEDEEVGGGEHERAEENAGGFAAGEIPHRFEGFVAAEEHFTEDAADVLVVDACFPLFQPVKGGLVGVFVDGVAMVLGEVADLDGVAGDEGAGVGGQDACEEFEERALTPTVVSNDGDLVSFMDFTGEFPDDGVGGVVAFREGVGFEDDLARGLFWLGKTDVGALDVRFFQVEGLEPVDFPDARLDLAGPGSSPEFGDELFELGDFFLFGFVFIFGSRADGGFRDEHGVVIAGIGDDGFVVDVSDVGANGVEEVAIVADDDESAVIAFEELFEPGDRLEVEVVGRLVEEKRLRMAEKGLAEEDPELPVGGDLVHLLPVELFGDSHPDEKHFCLGFRGVAIFVGNHFFELAQANADGVGHLFVVEPFALFEGAPEPFIAHDHGVDHLHVSKIFDPLFQKPHFFGKIHGAGCLGLGSHNDLHQGRFARAVGSGEAIATIFVEGEGDVFEKSSVSDPL